MTSARPSVPSPARPQDAARACACEGCDLAERIADLVVARLTSLPASSRRLVSAEEVAGALGVSRAFVYEHAVELGGKRLTGGTRPRWRFDPDQALRAWDDRYSSESPKRETASGSRPRRSRPAGVAAPTAGLLPVGRKSRPVR